MSKDRDKKILMIIASQKFRDEELWVPKKHFEINGFDVTIASSRVEPSKGMLGAVVTPDIVLKNIRVEDYQGVIFVGGNGATEYWEDPLAHRIAQQAFKENKILGAICIAPVILAKAGLLKGRKATVWPSELEQLKNNGAILTAEDVVRDDKIITANGPEAASQFAQTIMESLT